MHRQNGISLFWYPFQQRELFVGSINFWSMFGALGAHWICDRYGRRLSFIVAAASFILGIIIMACAWSYPVIMFGRVFVGLGVGFGLAVCFECLCLYVIALEIILMLFLPLFLIAWNTD
jgi:predicted MFS family arabinose efflux permease